MMELKSEKWVAILTVQESAIPAKTPGNYPLRNVKEIPIIKAKQRFFENSFFPVTITEWSDLDYSLHNAPYITVFKQNILKFIQLGVNEFLNSYNSYGFKLLTKPRIKSFTRSQI